jgi:hypothetical protein
MLLGFRTPGFAHFKLIRRNVRITSPGMTAHMEHRPHKVYFGFVPIGVTRTYFLLSFSYVSLAYDEPSTYLIAFANYSVYVCVAIP